MQIQSLEQVWILQDAIFSLWFAMPLWQQGLLRQDEIWCQVKQFHRSLRVQLRGWRVMSNWYEYFGPVALLTHSEFRNCGTRCNSSMDCKGPCEVCKCNMCETSPGIRGLAENYLHKGFAFETLVSLRMWKWVKLPWNGQSEQEGWRSRKMPFKLRLRRTVPSP